MNAARNVYFVHDDGTAELHIGDSVILIDANDVEKLSCYQWTIGTHGYVTHGAGKQQVLMHRVIMSETSPLFIDHINRNKLDNRKTNLRTCSPAQNMMNRGCQADGNNPYKGVCLTRDGAWQAQININGKAIYLGRFVDSVTAAKAYDTAARRLFGEYAYLNFPGSDEDISVSIKHRRKLTFDEVNCVRELYAQGLSIQELADLFSHSDSAIRRIVKNKTFQKEKVAS